ncbi:LuxR C-terminal-related transcriptional regulator [Streptomyces sp. NBC_01166]|uniref:LuxR C-terminal-related transcriptional regulator n=1 Tax=unclassified Streptomyces TaxID=2593676 RepID=UPI003718C70B|nr:LuxR C-terminal-related transcriptional regulator [Streptomyces sp. NBC_01166]
MINVLRERDDAHALLAAGTERALRGVGGLVLLRGATGTGRTAVLEAAAAHAAERGLCVLRARCSPEDDGMPLSTVGRLLGHVPEYAGMPSSDYHRRAARLWELLRSLAAQSPLLLAVDDVHLADRSSRRWLAEAAGHLDRMPVLMVATERSQYDIDPQSAGLTHALSASFVRTHTLSPLTDEASAEMLEALLPGADPEWTAECVRASAGHPLLLLALLDDLRGTPPLPLPDSCAALYPGAYPAAVAWWLDSAGTATADVARALAALEEVGTPDPADDPPALLAEATGADPARVAGWLTAMTRLGLLRLGPDGQPRYAHPLLRDAVLTGWPTPRRQEVHRAAAEALLSRGGRVEAVARHLLRAPVVGKPWALRVLRDAVTVAVDATRADDAVGYLRRALDEPLSDARRQRLLTELGSLEYHSADAGAAISRLAEALHLEGEPRDRVHTAIALGTALAGQGEVRTAMGMLRRTEAGLSGHPGLARTVQTATAILSDQDQVQRQEAYGWLGERAARSPELVGTAGQALLVRYAATAGLVSAQDAMRQVHALLAEPADPSAEPFLLGTAAAVAQWADELDEAERLVERGLALQSCSLLHPMHRALVNTRADIAAARGDQAALLAAAADPRRIPADAGPGNIDAHVLMALVHADRTDEAQRLAAGFDLRRAPDSWELNRFLYARGVLRAAVGDSAGALHDWLECGRRQLAREVVSPVVTPWRTAVAECGPGPGAGEAVELAEEELRLAEVWNTPRTVGRALRVLGTVTGGRRGLELAGEAVLILRGAAADTDMELIPALLAQGRQLMAAGERSRARDCLREAAERAERKGAVRLQALAARALREGGARHHSSSRTGSAALTASERRVAELAADGRTNTEIAGLLHLARRTVETHLTHAYRKLRIRRRSELTAALGTRGEEA